MSEILLCGASGLIGSNLIQKLKQKNHKIVLLSTKKKLEDQKEVFYWNPDKGIFPDLDLGRFSVCFNFCGSGIFDKAFSEKRKKELLDSRVIPIRFLSEQFSRAGIRLPHFISASAIAYYPNVCLSELHEDSTPGEGFLSELVGHWEAEANSFHADQISVVRIGIVLSAKGGFLEKLLPPIRMYAGAATGTGRETVSWIHIEDLCGIFIHLYEHKLGGTFNGVAPNPQSMDQIVRICAGILKKPLFLPPIPAFVLRLIFGRGRAEILLSSQHVSAEKVLRSQYQFHFPDAGPAIQNLLAS